MEQEFKKLRKICFVLQQHTPGTHMDYVYEMARTLRHDEGLPLTLFLEKGGVSEEDKSWCVGQRFSVAPLRIPENFFKLLKMRLTGHTIFYVHYSFLSAISASIITKIFGGTVYYWNCGQPWMYDRPFFTALYEKFAYKCIDYLVTGVEAVVPGYLKTYGLKREQVIVIPNWIDLNHVKNNPEVKEKVRMRLGIPKGFKTLLFVHTISKRYGAHLLPQILNELKEVDVHFVIAGDGNLRETITKEFESLGLADRAHLLGYAERPLVEELLQTADVFVMPSEGAGSPHSLIEAMAYTVPFVSYDVGGVKETAPPDMTEFIFEYPNTKSIAGGIATLLQDKDIYASFKKSEQEWVKNFSKPVIVQKFKSLF